MAKKNKSKDVSELTPEERIAQLEAENAKLKKGLAGKPAINPRDLKFETEEEGQYCFTCLKFNMDGVEYDASEVLQNEETEVLAKLVAMKSGIIEKLED